MSDVIRLLPDSVANQIAAGEVIQRPASVIKELVENAIDAGATTVSIFVTDAGRTLIQVVDDGCGMTENDARMAFERHATSKIQSAADLFELRTMGFRGEALASICAVAQVELRTRPHDAEIGTRLVINGSKVEAQEPYVCAEGSSMMVKNLFFNIPARRKFLKKDAVELGHIMREFERLALVNPSVQMSITSNGSLLHQLHKATPKQRIADLFGKTLDKQLIPVRTDTSIVRLDGFVSLPEYARKRNTLQYLFVNGRNMRHPYFHKAVMHCFENLLPPDTQPNYFLNFEVDPATIDVNIHPTKNEIKFENESAIWQILVSAIRESLGRFNAATGMDFDLEDAPDIPAFDPDAAAAPSEDIDTGYNPFESSGLSSTRQTMPGMASHRSSIGTRVSSINTRDWEKLYNDFTSKREDALGQLTDTGLGLTEPANPVINYITYGDKYIIAVTSAGLSLIDRYRAHIRVLYDRYIAMQDSNTFQSQSILFPETLKPSPSQLAELSGLMTELLGIGYRIEPDSEGNVIITGIPAVLGTASPVDSLMQILDDCRNTSLPAEWHLAQRVALSMARSAAVRPGQSISSEQTERLLEDLFASSDCNHTPDGLKILQAISMDELSKKLG